MAEVKEILYEALKLGPEERADVASELLASLEVAPEAEAEAAEVEAAWATEIERRARRVLAGASPGVSWGQVRRRAEDHLTKR